MTKPISLHCTTPRDFETPVGSPPFEASGVAFVRDHFVVVDDKSNDLFVFGRDWHFVRKISGGDFGELHKFEDIAVDGDDIYVMGDHSNSRVKETVEDHSIGFRFRLAGQTADQWKIENVIPFHLRFGTEQGWNAEPEKNKVKVEGLAVLGGVLFVGVRESAIFGEGEVLILSGKLAGSAESIVDLGTYLRFPTSVLDSIPPRPLKISGLAVDPKGQMLILTSANSSSKFPPEKNKTREERFMGNRLFYWSVPRGKKGEIPVELRDASVNPLFKGFKAEGVTWAVQPDGKEKIELVFDNEATLPALGWPSAFASCGE